MPFQQPAPTTVRQIHFRGRTYTFPVESVLPSGSYGAVLHLEASTGYLLTTSESGTPQTEQTLPYIEQADGSWRAKGTVNLTVNAASLINGSVTLQDPLGEILSLPVRIAPTLFVDTSEISFDETKLGDTTATILNIRQRGALTPVFLSVEPKHQFAIADAKAALISLTNLTINPAFEGSNVIVIYKPTRAGRNLAKLVITTPYETKTVQLIGQPGGILGQFQWPEITNWQWPQRLRLPRPRIPQLLQWPQRLRLQWPQVPRWQRPEIPRVLMPATSQVQLATIPQWQQPEIPHKQRPAIFSRGPLLGGLAVLAFGGVLWLAFSMLTQPGDKTNETAHRSGPSTQTHISLATPARQPEKSVTQAPKIEPAETSIEEDTQAVEPPAPEPIDKAEERIVAQMKLNRAELKKLSRPKPVKPTEVVSAKPSSPTFSTEQVSDLEKELNRSVSSKQP